MTSEARFARSGAARAKAEEPEAEGGPEVQAVSATLPRTCSVERLAEFFAQGQSAHGRRLRLGYPAGYFRWLARVPGHDRYLDAALLDHAREVVGAAVSRPLTLGMWSNMKLRSAIRDAVVEGQRERSTKGWVRYLTREKDADLAKALAGLLPEEHYALKAAVIEFLGVVPNLEKSGQESLLLDLILTEARAAGYDYLLCWGHGRPPPPALASRSVPAEAVLEVLAEDDAGLLQAYNGLRYGARTTKQLALATRDRIRGNFVRLRRRIAILPATLRRLATRRPAEHAPPLAAERPDAVRIDAAALLRPVPTEEALTFDGIRIRCVAGPNLSLDDGLVESLRDLLAETQDEYGIFPTYDAPSLRALVSPTRPDRRLVALYATHGDDPRLLLTRDETHDVLSYVASRDGQVLAFLFGHRLPCYEGGPAREAWLIRAQHFRKSLNPIARADVVQRCAEAARAQYGIERSLLVRHAGLLDLLHSRLVLGSRRTPDRLTLYYLPLSERARAELAVLERRLPVGYL